MKRVLVLVAVLVAAACGSDDPTVWSQQTREDGLEELEAHCLSSFVDDAEASQFCGALSAEALTAAEELGRCDPGEAVEAIRQGIPAETQEQADAFLRCTVE